MTKADSDLLTELDLGSIAEEDFLKKFSVDLKSDNNFIRKEVQEAIKSNNPDKIRLTIPMIWFSADISNFVDLLNELLINPNHTSHQQIAKTLQDEVPDPTTVPFVRKALETNFDYLQYSCSDSGTIAKWFSWLLFSIGTKEAIDLMKEYSDSPDKEVAFEMKYRLKKFRH